AVDLLGKTNADRSVEEAEGILADAKQDLAEANSQVAVLKMQYEKTRSHGVATSGVNIVVVALSVVGGVVLIGAIVAGVLVMRRRRMKGRAKFEHPRITVPTTAQPRGETKVVVKTGSEEKKSAKSSGTNATQSDSKQEPKLASTPPPPSPPKDAASDQKLPENDDKLAKTPKGKRIGKDEVEDSQGRFQRQKIGQFSRWIAVIRGACLRQKTIRYAAAEEVDNTGGHALDGESDEIKTIHPT
ncbi:hypothetical protein PFISCL1PPCAC_8609, partial [Pristionchus fissidentatus]